MLYPRYGKSEKTKIQAEKVRQRSVLENGECVGFSECGRGFVPQ